MKVPRFVLLPVLVTAAFAGGVAFQKFGVPAMSKTTYYKLNEPLLLNAEGEQKDFHMLPAGTALYKDYEFPEGHTRYIVYINVKGSVDTEKIESDKVNLVDPIWGYRVRPEDLPALMASTPISKEDLVRILKARKMTREDLAQIVREWRD
jgi:hypothetical protein